MGRRCLQARLVQAGVHSRNFGGENYLWVLFWARLGLLAFQSLTLALPLILILTLFLNLLSLRTLVYHNRKGEPDHLWAKRICQTDSTIG